jgi:hypothetical protein
LTTADDFPETALGMPVVDIATLRDLINGGDLDGRAVAVAGYWIEGGPWSCPGPNKWQSALIDFCYFHQFSDVPFDAYMCSGNSCRSQEPPAGANVVTPRLLESVNTGSMRHVDNAPGADAPAVVLVGHAGDPRQLTCSGNDALECSRSFVVDRVAWVNGREVELEMTDTDRWYEPESGVPDLIDAVDAPIISMAAMFARDADGVDPRLHAVGPSKVWVVRTIIGDPRPDATYDAESLLIGDATGEVMAYPLATTDYQPAFFSPQAAVRDDDPNSRLQPLYVIEGTDGHGIAEGSISGFGMSRGDDDVGLYYPGAPVILDPGRYLVRAWMGTVENEETWSEPVDSCTAEFDLGAGDHLRLEAAFPTTDECIWREPTFDGSSLF